MDTLVKKNRPRSLQEKLLIKKQISKETQTQILAALQKFWWTDRA